MLRELPTEIGALKFLQTLDCNARLPSSIGLLAQLLCLRVCTGTIPSVIGKLTSLEDLKIETMCINSESIMFLTELGNLKELRVLCIEFLVNKSLEKALQESLVESLRNLPKLRYLHIHVTSMPGLSWEAPGFVLSSGHLQHLKLSGICLCSLPAWISSGHLASLTTLSLILEFLAYNDMSTLGKLPELCYLELRTIKSNLVVCSGDGYFQKLRYFSLNNCVVTFWRDKSRAPVMQSLDALKWFVNVKELIDICFRQGHHISFFSTVIGLENIASLEKVTINLLCQNATPTEVDEVEAALRRTATAHPNHPTLKIERHQYDEMITSDQEIQVCACLIDFVLYQHYHIYTVILVFAD